MPSPVMTVHATMPYRLQLCSSWINHAMLLQASHRFVIANLLLTLLVVQASAKVTIVCEYEVIFDLLMVSFPMTLSDP